MKLLVVVTPPSIYHGCYTWKTFWEEIFTDEENFTVGEFSDVNMKTHGCHNVSKYREIKGTDKNATFDISLNFDIMDKMRIVSSEPKYNLGISGKWLIISIGLMAKAIPKKYKKARYAIGNFSMRELLRVIRDFEKLPHKTYEKRRPKHEPTNSYF